MVICAPEFTNSARIIAEWRTKRGFITQVVTTDEAGSTASAIRDYIKNVYDTCDPAPSYILIIGDAEYVPVWYETIHPSHDFLTGDDFFYTNTKHLAYFEQDEDYEGYSSRRFAKTSEDMRNYMFAHGYNPERIYSTHGDVLNYGKAYFLTKFPSIHSIYMKTTIEMFSLLGDPAMEIWTGIPVEFLVPEPLGMVSVIGILFFCRKE